VTDYMSTCPPESRQKKPRARTHASRQIQCAMMRG
jgi:hypothetical protein